MRACRQQDSAGRAAEEPEAERQESGGIARGSAQVREYLEQQHLVRAGVSGGQGAGQERGSGLAIGVRVGFQVQQRSVEVDAEDQETF